MPRFHMNLGDQWAGSIDRNQIQTIRLGLDHRRNAVSREDHMAASRHILQVLYKNCPLGLQVFDHNPIVNNFVAHVDRATELIEGFENHLDSSFDTGTKTAGPAEDDFHDSESVVAMPFPLKWALLSIATSLLISANHSWDRLLNAAGNALYPTEPKT